MAQTDTDATAKIVAAMMTQILNKLIEKGVIDHDDVTEMTAAATKALQDPKAAGAFDGLAERYAAEIGG